MAIVLALSTTGCATAIMVKNPYPWIAYAPANRASEEGVVAYKTRGGNSEVDSGRFSAYKLMGQACRGRGYVITSGPYDEQPSGLWAHKQNFRDKINGIPPSKKYIHFQCIAD